MGKKVLNWFTQELTKLEKEGLLNSPKVIESPIGAEITIDGKKLINFASNNYLGLANDERLKKAAISAIKKFGVGPAAVRTIAGTTKLHTELEKLLATFKKAESVITFQSGFTANLAVMPAIAGEGDVIFSDELNHASIIDACRLSKAQVVRYKHLDTKDLEEKITEALKVRPLKVIIVSDGVFSMDGDIAPLPDLVKISQKFNTLLVIDGAHGEGVLGKNGRGIVDHFNLHNKVDIEVGTLSKAFGVVGGFAAGKKEIIDWLRQRARPFLFSSAMTIPDVASSIEAVKILSKSEKPVKCLWENANYLKTELKKLGFDTGKSQTPIIPIMIGDVVKAKQMSKNLFENGVFAVALGYPTVPMGTARIRLIVSAVHTKLQLDRAIGIFGKVGREMGIINK